MPAESRHGFGQSRVDVQRAFETLQTVAELPVLVVAPGGDGAVRHQRERVLVRRRDRPCPLQGAEHRVGDGVFFLHHDVGEPLFPVVAGAVVAELAVAVGAPGDERAVAEQREVERGGGRDLGDVGEAFDLHGGDLEVVPEDRAELAVVVFTPGDGGASRGLRSPSSRVAVNGALTLRGAAFALLAGRARRRAPGDGFSQRGKLDVRRRRFGRRCAEGAAHVGAEKRQREQRASAQFQSLAHAKAIASA